MGEVTERNGKLPPHKPNITSSRKISNLLGAEDNKTGISKDMAAATDLEEEAQGGGQTQQQMQNQANNQRGGQRGQHQQQ